MKISPVSEISCHLGEGPVWDPSSGFLYWVDSLAPAIYCYDYAGDKVRHWGLPGDSVGSLAPCESGGLLLAMDRGFYRFEPNSAEIELVAEPLAGSDGIRFNDGKVDPFGAFVAGGMNIDYQQHQPCPMYRIDKNYGVEKILDGFDCFNGPCFSGGGEYLYVTGRSDGLIEVFDYGQKQRPRNARPLIENCNPDGATVDAEGYIWSAQWDDECLLRLAPDGTVDCRLQIPGQIVSSLMFGGPDLEHIFVTTVGGPVHGAKPRTVDAGKLLVIEGSGFRGRPEPMFKG